MMVGLSIAWLAFLWIANYFKDQCYVVVSIKKKQHSLVERFVQIKFINNIDILKIIDI